MAKVVGVKFKDAGKLYYFSPAKIDVKMGDNVIVETARGLEFGKIVMDVTEVKDSEIVSPLKNIIRIATEKDQKRHRDNLAKKDHAMKLCQEKIDAHHLEMKLIDVEYTFDNSKVVSILRRTAGSISGSWSRIWLLYSACGSSCGRSVCAMKPR